MKCLNCNINDAIKYSKYSNGKFCSSKCARSYSTKNKRADINQKVSAKLKNRKVGVNSLSDEEKVKIFNRIKIKKHETDLNKILNSEYSDLSYYRLRKRVIHEQDYKCGKCGLSEWLKEKIIFEIDHIDGNCENNNRNNLIALCPNCHSFTDTWRGKNKNNNINKISDDSLLIELINNNFNIRQALLSVGLAAKGGNYKRCYRLKREYYEIVNDEK